MARKLKRTRHLDSREMQILSKMRERGHLRSRFICTLQDLALPPVRQTRSEDVTSSREVKLMERAGIGARGAKNMAWFENDRDTYQHHAEYLKRLNRLRDDLINQEQSNLANALERLRMRSYGREYIFSKPKEKEGERMHGGKRRHAHQSPDGAERKSLITTLQRFQQMRPKRSPPVIMPLEGRQILEPQTSERIPHPRSEPLSRGSVDESVRLNLQRLGPAPSIPRMNRQNGYQRDIILESSQVKRSRDSNNSSNFDDKKAQTKLPKTIPVRNMTRPNSEDLTLTPQTVKLEKLKDEDRMHLGTLRDYYCIYYIPPPSPNRSEEGESINTSVITLPPIAPEINGRNDLNLSNNNRPDIRYGMSRAIPKLQEYSPPNTGDDPFSMFISGNKMEAHPPNFTDNEDDAIARVESVNVSDSVSDVSFRSGRIREEKVSVRNNDGKREGREKRRLIVEMPSIVCNVATPPTRFRPRGNGSNGLTKAFKQKEIRQRELTNLLEDVKELNKRTEELKQGRTSTESRDTLLQVD